MKVAKILHKILNNYSEIIELFEDNLEQTHADAQELEIYILEPSILIKNKAIKEMESTNILKFIEDTIKTETWDKYIGIYSVFPSDSIDRSKIYNYSYIIYNKKTRQFLNKYFYTKKIYQHVLCVSDGLVY